LIDAYRKKGEARVPDSGRFESDLTILYQVSAFHTLPELNTYPIELFDLSLVSDPFLISKMVGEVGTNTGTFQSHISRRYSKRVIHHHESLSSARYTHDTHRSGARSFELDSLVSDWLNAGAFKLPRDMSLCNFDEY
jgi:hypothetical protein